MNTRGIPLLEQGNGREVLRNACRKAKIPIAVIESLIDAELEQTGKLKKRGIRERFDEILAEVSEAEERG